MPDLRGLSAREALKALSRIGMTARMTGDGFVLEQNPEAGAALVRGDACALTLGRRAPVAATRRVAVTLRELAGRRPERRRVSSPTTRGR